MVCSAKSKRQYLLTLQVSRYCFLALQGSVGALRADHPAWLNKPLGKTQKSGFKSEPKESRQGEARQLMALSSRVFPGKVEHLAWTWHKRDKKVKTGVQRNTVKLQPFRAGTTLADQGLEESAACQR